MISKVGIVILNYKTYLDTENLVNELLSQPVPNIDLRIQIVDNNSPNESFAYLLDAFNGISCVNISQSGANLGFAIGNNYGLRLLKAYNPDFALVLNNDVHFDISVVEHLIEIYGKLDCPGVIAPLQKKPNGEYETFIDLTCKTYLQDLQTYTFFLCYFMKKMEYKSNTSYPNVQKVDIIPGCFMFISYKTFESIGFFDESTFLFGEERFIYKKITEAGLQNYLILDSSYIHEHSKTINSNISSLKQQRLILDGKIKYTEKYQSFPRVKVLFLKIMWQYYKIGISVKVVLKNILFPNKKQS